MIIDAKAIRELDVPAAEKVLGATGVKSADGVVVPPAEGNGTMLAFVKG